MKQSLHKQNNLESLAAENLANKPGSPIIVWFFLTGLLFLYVACLGKPRTECFPCTSTECGAPLRCTLAAPLPGSYCVPIGSTPLSRCAFLRQDASTTDKAPTSDTSPGDRTLDRPTPSEQERQTEPSSTDAPAKETAPDRPQALCAKDPKCLWFRHFPGEKAENTKQRDLVLDLAIDLQGNTYAVGQFAGKTAFSPSHVLTAQNSDCFVVKMSRFGDVLWVKTFGGTSLDLCKSIAINSKGKLIVAGTYRGQVSFGTFSQKSDEPDSDIFVLQMNPSGEVEWALSMKGAEHDDPVELTLDAQDNIYITGLFAGSLQVGNIRISGTNTPQGQTTYDLFVAKLDPQGNALWLKGIHGLGDLVVHDLAWGKNKQLLLTGAIAGAVTYDGNKTSLPIGELDLFVARLDDTTGMFTWFKRYGAPRSYSAGRHLAIEDTGQFYLVGRLIQQLQLGNFKLESAPKVFGLLVSKFAADGTPLWAITAKNATDGQSTVERVILDAPKQRLLLSGLYKGTVEFGTFKRTFQGGPEDLYVATMDLNGKFLAVTTAGGNGDDALFAMERHGEQLIVGGFFKGEKADFGGTSVSSTVHIGYLWRLAIPTP